MKSKPFIAVITLKALLFGYKLHVILSWAHFAGLH